MKNFRYPLLLLLVAAVSACQGLAPVSQVSQPKPGSAPSASPSASPSPAPSSPAATASAQPTPTATPPIQTPSADFALPITVTERRLCGGAQRSWQMSESHEFRYAAPYPPVTVGLSGFPQTEQRKQLSEPDAQNLLSLLAQAQNLPKPSASPTPCATDPRSPLVFDLSVKQHGQTKTWTVTASLPASDGQAQTLTDLRKALDASRNAQAAIHGYSYQPKLQRVWIPNAPGSDYPLYSLDEKGLLQGRHPESLKADTAHPDFVGRLLNAQELADLTQMLNRLDPVKSFDGLGVYPPNISFIGIVERPIYWVFTVDGQERVVPEVTSDWYPGTMQHTEALRALKAQLDKWLFEQP